jgi:DNA-binding transcriptional regulator YiaG
MPPVAERYHPRVTPDQVRRVRKALGLSQSRFAALLGVHLVTVKKWETGAQRMRPMAERLIRLLAADAKRSRRTKRGGR